MGASGCQLLNPTKSSPTPGSVTPTVVSPEPEPTPTEEPAPTAEAPASTKVPPGPNNTSDVKQVLDVSAFDYVEFASPSGRLVCGIFSDAAQCFLPPGFQGKLPSSAKVCSDPDFIVNTSQRRVRQSHVVLLQRSGLLALRKDRRGSSGTPRRIMRG